jgi:hypothetical protein
VVTKRDAIQSRVGIDAFLGQTSVPLRSLLIEKELVEAGTAASTSSSGSSGRLSKIPSRGSKKLMEQSCGSSIDEGLGTSFSRVEKWYPLSGDRGSQTSAILPDAAIQLVLTLYVKEING